MKVYAKANCGCCEIEMFFKTKASAELAFNKLGLTCGGELIDDKGVTHKNIDTFYGLSFNEKEIENRGLDYLLGKIKGEDN